MLTKKDDIATFNLLNYSIYGFIIKKISKETIYEEVY